MAGPASPDAHWRDSARAPRFWIFDFRAAFPLIVFLFHIKLWTFVAAIVSIVILGLLDRFGFTVTVFVRWTRTIIAGQRKLAKPWWKEERVR